MTKQTVDQIKEKMRRLLEEATCNEDKEPQSIGNPYKISTKRKMKMKTENPTPPKKNAQEEIKTAKAKIERYKAGLPLVKRPHTPS